jgi:hypothetical protein
MGLFQDGVESPFGTRAPFFEPPSHTVHNVTPSPLGDELLCPAFNPPDIILFFVLFAALWFKPFVVQTNFQD